MRNSQRGKRALPRHRLDRDSLIPLLECSPPSSPLSPPPLTTHSPAVRHPPYPCLPPTQRSPRPPTLHLLRRTGEPPSTCSTYTLARLCQFLSCCRRCHCRHRYEDKGERESGSEREREMACLGSTRNESLKRKRDRGYDGGWPRLPLYLSHSTYTHTGGDTNV